MSYDVYFLSRCERQSWDEVLEAMEDAAEHSKPIPARLLEAWERIVPQARLLLGEVNITEYKQESRYLNRSGTGLDLSVSVTSEKETGLTTYDLQTERPLAEIQPRGPIELMPRITEDLPSRYGG
ncbi:hypothetical protein ACFW2I_22960 [Streptomyces nigra]|uniref:hypothetical protein n=1 Tax=Streptomyces nigra TaxID=1827580 RepID=UPI0036D02CB9